MSLLTKVSLIRKIKTLLHGSINGIDFVHKFNPERILLQERMELRRRHGIPDNSLVIGFLGRIVKDKGIADLSLAWETIRASYPETDLLLVGPVERGNPVSHDILRCFSDDPRIHLPGPVLDAPPFYSIMDILVLPSHREGFGLAAIEAAAMRLPVVATRIPGCIDAVEEGKTGLLVPPRAPVELAEAIGRYLRDPALREKHGNAGRCRVEKLFRQSDIWSALHAEYLELAAQYGVTKTEQ